MAKATKTPAATAEQPQTGGVALPSKGGVTKAQRELAASKDVFVYKADLTKGAPQAKGIVNILKAAGKPMTRADLVAKMNGVITTRQPLGRILSYYQKDLVAAGAITMSKAELPAPAAPVAAAA